MPQVTHVPDAPAEQRLDLAREIVGVRQRPDDIESEPSLLRRRCRKVRRLLGHDPAEPDGGAPTRSRNPAREVDAVVHDGRIHHVGPLPRGVGTDRSERRVTPRERSGRLQPRGGRRVERRDDWASGELRKRDREVMQAVVVHDVEGAELSPAEPEHEPEVGVMLPHPGIRHGVRIPACHFTRRERLDVEEAHVEGIVGPGCREHADLVAAGDQFARQEMSVGFEAAREGLRDGIAARCDEAHPKGCAHERSSE